MTINELIAEFNRLQLSGDEQVRVQAFGGMRHGKNINKVSVGFDWDKGAVVLHPEIPLTIFERPEAKKAK
jgi:hypothetical protein